MKRDFERALHPNSLLVGYRALMLGSKQNPVVPVFAKIGLKTLGIIGSERVRPPLTGLEQGRKTKLEALILSMKEEFFDPDTHRISLNYTRPTYSQALIKNTL